MNGQSLEDSNSKMVIASKNGLLKEYLYNKFCFKVNMIHKCIKFCFSVMKAAASLLESRGLT